MADSTVTPAQDADGHSSPYGWDWTQTTHVVKDDATVRQLVRALEPDTTVPGKGLQGWSQSVEAYDAQGFKIGAVYFGGGRDDCHVKATSAAADKVRPLVSGRFDARTARVDTCVDTLMPFEDLGAMLRETAQTYRSKRFFMESFEGDETCGRTWILGAPSSAIRIRVYEKWLESLGQYVEGTNRVEVQLRPPSRVKGDVSSWTTAQTFCASKVARDLAGLIGAELADKATLHVSRGTPDLERTMQVMGEQYGPSFDRFMEWSGGDLDKVLGYMARQQEEPDPVAALTARLLETQRALESLGARRVIDDALPPF